jgi:hypothetical protein
LEWESERCSKESLTTFRSIWKAARKCTRGEAKTNISGRDIASKEIYKNNTFKQIKLEVKLKVKLKVRL